MDKKREKIVRGLIKDLRDLDLNFNSYLDDSGYADLMDSIIEGKIRALKYYLNYLNMTIVSKEIDNITFESGKAVINLEILRNFILNEVELELVFQQETK
ncbi:hypothetical protein [Pseudobacillus badius]|uniref:hypothetical protein n=1 Tax=Bacillus badius TaxID=1455 RepID=UPI0007B04CEA|nr:hypothetical protein [Bacillus badius]KZO00823.1 hypothetical protein A4244_02905 [Bacillus badius]MED0666944.1 hypothetical protein [Bacillus badius]OCS88231.1 hypothetical protein A6M11_02905 [Bacillus badius]OVE53240.1 hypothetical protein B1A98_00005 [Bacillus badius]TDW05576.1 hypothetical protein B0G66_1011 [Bacillus badius]